MNGKNRVVLVFCISFLVLIMWPRIVQKFFPQYSSFEVGENLGENEAPVQERTFTPSSHTLSLNVTEEDKENSLLNELKGREEGAVSDLTTESSISSSLLEKSTDQPSLTLVLPIAEGLALEVSKVTGSLLSIQYDREKVDSFFSDSCIPLFSEVSGLDFFSEGDFEVSNIDSSVIFRKEVKGIIWEKRYTWSEEEATFVFSESFLNHSDEEFQFSKGISLTLVGGSLRTSLMDKTWVYAFDSQRKSLDRWKSGASFSLFGSPKYRDDVLLGGSKKWFAQVDKFFVYRVLPLETSSDSYLRFIKTAVTVGHKTKQSDLGYVVWTSDPFSLQPSEKKKMIFSVQLIPKVRSVLSAVDKDLTPLSSYPLNILTQPILWLISFFFGLLNWGYIWALILVTLLFKLIVFPLNYKGTQSMQQLKDLTPKINEINQKYANDPQAKMVALKEFYSQKNVRPGGGCLYMLIPLPFFFAFFYALQNDFYSRGQSFLWIPDLSSPDPFKILPIIVGLSWYFLQKFTQNASPASGSQVESQQKMLMFLSPVLMAFFSMSLPASLSVNWVVSNLLTVALTVWMARRQKTNKKVEVVDPKRKIKF